MNNTYPRSKAFRRLGEISEPAKTIKCKYIDPMMEAGEYKETFDIGDEKRDPSPQTTKQTAHRFTSAEGKM